MTEYTIIVKIPNAGNKEVSYSVNLTGLYEDYPGDYFRSKENRQRLCQDIQKECFRTISDENLDQIVAKWISDIKSGFRRTTIALDLPPESPAIPSQTSVSSTTPTPATTATLDYRPPVKKPDPNLRKQKTSTTASNSTTPQPNTTPVEEKTEEPTASIETSTNQADF